MYRGFDGAGLDGRKPIRKAEINGEARTQGVTQGDPGTQASQWPVASAPAPSRCATNEPMTCHGSWHHEPLEFAQTEGICPKNGVKFWC